MTHPYRASRKELFSPSVFITLRILILRNNRLDNLKALHLHSALLPCLVEVDLAHNLFEGAVPKDALPDSILRLGTTPFSPSHIHTITIAYTHTHTHTHIHTRTH